MSAETRFDLLLLGYRNDLARERVIAYLRALPASGGGPVAIERDDVLPRTLLAGLDHDRGLRMLAVLRERGAQVRLVTVEESVEAAADPEAALPAARGEARPGTEADHAPPGRLASRAAPRLAWLVLAFALLSAAYFRLAPLPPPLPPPGMEMAAGFGAAPARLDLAPHRLNDEAVRLNASGQFADAVGRLREALERAPDEPALRSNLKIVLHNWAVAELNSDNTRSAVALLEEGLTIEEDPHLLSALGIARARQGEWQPARGALERALALGADDPYTLTALGKVYRQQGEREAAVEMFHRARDLGAGGPEFQETLTRLERELDAEWDFAEMRSPHFRISFAAGEEQSDAAAQVVARGLEEAYFHVGRKFDLYPSERVPVVLYASEEFHDITQTPSWTSGVYDGRIKLPVGGITDSDDAVLTRTLRHEYGHVLIHQLTRGRCPVWLNEGAAIWMEEDREGEREDWAMRTLSGQVLFPLGELTGSFTRLPGDRVHAAYAQSYLAVRTLVERSGGRRLRELLASLGEGRSIGEAFHETFYEDVARFEAELIRQLTQG
jgi:tetratricopeptide (TPR) repeat protein